MVGITVGLVTVLIITQTMSLFQGGRNTITGGASAQENGLFAMQLVATDIRSTGAGYYSTSSTNSSSLQACTNVCSFYGSGTGGCTGNGSPTGSNRMASISGDAWTGASYTLKVPLFPVIIENQPSSAGVSNVIQYAPGSDIVTVRSSARFMGSIPAALNGTIDMSNHDPLPVNRSFGFSTGDLALVVDGSHNCTVFELTGVDANALTLSHALSSFNPSGFTFPTGDGGKSFGNTAMVYNLGDNSASAQGVNFPGVVIAREYSVAGPNGTSLQMRQFGAANPNTGTTAAAIMPMADGIVALKAQYGISTDPTTPDTTACANTASLAGWVGTDHAAWGTHWSPDTLDQAHAACIRAIRILVVARSGNREATTVTSACTTDGFGNGPCPSGGTTQTDTNLPAINIATLPWAANGEWQHYRYKTYLTVVPIRNILWNGSWSFTGQ